MPVTVSVMTPLFSKLLLGQFHVIGPRAPVIALVGEEAVLSCQLSPSMDAQNMEVRWYRNDPFGLLHHYSTSQDDMEEQRPEYQGRTEFLKENITRGHVALRIHSIQPSDGGEYACFFESSTYYNEATFQVLVTGSGMAPHVHIEHGNRQEIKLTCTSTRWYPEPELRWRDHQGLHLMPASETKTIGENGLFRVESSLTVDKSSTANVSCVVRNLILNVEKEVHVSVAGQFHVIGPRAPVIALVGEEAVLSCQLSPSMDAQNMEVKWYRNNPFGLVHHYGPSWNKMEEQRPEYQGRTEFLKENITKGHVALRIHPIQPSDGGEYRCFFESSSYYNIAQFKVLVTGSIKKKHGSLKKKHGKLHEEYELLMTTKETIEKENGKLHEELGLKLARRYAENVILDPETAHPYLQVAEDNKSVKGGDTLQELPKSRQRFDNLVCVLGQQIFSEGRHYWEVSVKKKIKWTLGICKDSVCRQGEIIVSPEAGFWTLCLNRSNDYQALANPRITLHLEKSPEIIGIFLDYKAGRVSFYNVTNLSHIYTYRKCFTEALRPYFYPGPPYNGQNEHPLTILSLRHINKPGRRCSV
nr:butyrophilin-like protein 2 [Neomonachus schauinslandi]